MSPFTKAQFRSLLVGYCIVVACSFAVQPLTKPMLPEVVFRAEKASHQELLSSISLPVKVAIGVVLGGVLLAGLVGLVGMFFLWRPGLLLFLGAVCVRTIIPPLLFPWHAQTMWSGCIDEIGLFYEGVILALAFFGPAKSLFTPKRSPSMQSSALPARQRQVGFHVGEDTRMSKVGMFLIVFSGVLIISLGLMLYWQHRSQEMPDIAGDNLRFLEYCDPEMAQAGREIKAAIATYKVEYGTYPASLDQLALTNIANGLSKSLLTRFACERIDSNFYSLDVRRGVVGIELGTWGDCRRLKSVATGSPAAKAGLAAGDYISHVDGKDVTHLSHSELLRALRGAPGTTVVLTVRRRNATDAQSVAITRGVELITISVPGFLTQPNTTATGASLPR